MDRGAWLATVQGVTEPQFGLPEPHSKLPLAVFLPGKSHGQRSLAGYSPWGHKESDVTQPHTHTHYKKDRELIPNETLPGKQSHKLLIPWTMTPLSRFLKCLISKAQATNPNPSLGEPS